MTDMSTQKLKKAFKKAKVFEIRRIVRRFKQLSSKKGTSLQVEKNKRKIERLEIKLELIKHLQFDDFLEAYDANEEIKTERSTNTEQYDTKSLAISKIIDIVRKQQPVLTTSDKSHKKLIKPYKGEISELKQGKTYTLEIEKDRNLTNSETTDLGHLSSGSSCSNDEEFDDFFSDVVNSNAGGSESEIQRKLINIPDVEPELLSDAEDVGNKPTFSMDSMFVGSLASGKEKSGRKQKRNGMKKDQKKFRQKGNRLGQRQRQKQWEKLYGRKANHLKKEKSKDHGNKTKNGLKDRKNHVKLGGDRKTKITKPETLHPSWQASKSKRKLESIVAFEGKKIKFDD